MTRETVITRRVFAASSLLIAVALLAYAALYGYAQITYGNFLTEERGSRYLMAGLMAVGCIAGAGFWIWSSYRVWKSTTRQ